MFSPEIVCDDKFIDMPSSTQALYFQLGMHADDDGFVGPMKVMRIIGAGQDDLKLLIMKKFVIPVENDTVVVVRHWKVNNLVRKDWYRPTIHVEAKEQLKVAQNGVYYIVNEPVPSSSTQVGSKVGNYKDEKEGELTPEEQRIKMNEIRAKMPSLLTQKKML